MSAPSSYRLDTLAVLLVGRLEATRRAHMDNTEAARAAFARVIAEGAEAVAQECREMLGDEVQARLLLREATETFLPRYTRLALAQNQVEARGYGGLLPDGPIGRIVATAIALVVATLSARILHLPVPIEMLIFFAAALTPVAPEIRVAWARRGWRGQLQELADDLGRVQDAAEALPHPTASIAASSAPSATLAPTASPEPVPPARRSPEEAH